MCIKKKCLWKLHIQPLLYMALHIHFVYNIFSGWSLKASESKKPSDLLRIQTSDKSGFLTLLGNKHFSWQLIALIIKDFPHSHSFGNFIEYLIFEIRKMDNNYVGIPSKHSSLIETWFLTFFGLWKPFWLCL